MRIYLHIGPERIAAERLQQVLAEKRDALLSEGILFPRSPGSGNHTRLYMAVTDPGHVDPLRYNRGYITAEKQARLREMLATELAAEVAQHRPQALILAAPQLGQSLSRRTELERLKALLAPLSQDIRIVAHVDEQARALVRHYGDQILDGRPQPLDRELALAPSESWWNACMNTLPPIVPQNGCFEETQGAPFWLDYRRLVGFWEDVFGEGTVALRPYRAAEFASDRVIDELRESFAITRNLGKPSAAPDAAPPSAAWLTRARRLNELLLHLLDTRNKLLPRQVWRGFLNEVAIEGAPTAPGSLSAISERFAADNALLCAEHPALAPDDLAPDAALPTWHEADPLNGYRASQYLLAFMYRIDKATREEEKAKGTDIARLTDAPMPRRPRQVPLTETARALMPPLAVQKFESLQTSSFRPHNRIGAVNEEELAAAYAAVPARILPQGSSGNVIVGCMKNEAPYILEWVAYHRAIGIDNFLIYTNGCEDGTDEILDRLQEMGVLQHRLNDDWKGNSPQQFALNRALKEPLIRNADWIVHIDVDEFINVRCGNGTLEDFFARVPDATNVAMTWRLFGHNGVTRLADDFVIEQFDTCAPKYCPKPHTVWGFKTMFKNIGAYGKMSCHRPNKLAEGYEDRVLWVNGSGEDMTSEVARNGWRNSRKSIGYDLLQLNHYALRSAESFLIKRQRGRALHVDRSIGLNYWIRMDWSDFRDITIKRNVPRVRAEYERLLEDDTLRSRHQKGLDWHRAKADELHAQPEFRELYEQALAVKLTETERVAYALALDMES